MQKHQTFEINNITLIDKIKLRINTRLLNSVISIKRRISIVSLTTGILSLSHEKRAEIFDHFVLF